MNEHVNFSLSKSGLVIDCKYPFFGASPDGVIKCRCCEFGVLEIKCPYSCRDKSFLTRSNESNFFLKKQRWAAFTQYLPLLLLPGSSTIEDLFSIIFRFCCLARE